MQVVWEGSSIIQYNFSLYKRGGWAVLKILLKYHEALPFIHFFNEKGTYIEVLYYNLSFWVIFWTDPEWDICDSQLALIGLSAPRTFVAHPHSPTLNATLSFHAS